MLDNVAIAENGDFKPRTCFKEINIHSRKDQNHDHEKQKYGKFILVAHAAVSF